MKKLETLSGICKLTLAVQVALGVIAPPTAAAGADESADVAALTKPTSSVEIGVENVSQKSAKFGEYNGLNDSGPYFLGNFLLRGGDAYDSFNGGSGVNRWQIRGLDLGTTSRELGASLTTQGRWTLSVGYDELRHYSTDSFRTPFLGSLGDDRFLLPASFGIIDANAADVGSQGMTAAQKAFFHSEDVYSGRRNFNFNAGYVIDPQWSVQVDYNRLDQSGAKLIGASFDATGGGAGEFTATFMNPTNYKTDTVEVALNWAGDWGHLTGSYFASFFHDDYTTVSFSNPFFDGGGGTTGTPPVGGAFPVNMYPTPPGNDFQQLTLTGGYDVGPTTRLAGGFSYGRNQQNDSFFNDPLLTSALPAGSLHGLVVNTHADLKLTDQTTRNLALSAGVKYDERDNRTPTYTIASFNSVAGDPWGPTVTAPVSYRKYQVEVAGNYRIDRMQSARFAYTYEGIDRWCNNAESNNAQSTDPTADLTYYRDRSCVQVPNNREHRLSAGYRLKAANNLSLNAGYTFAHRNADVNASFYNPMQTSAEGFENLGYLASFEASRTEHLVKAGANWQVSERLNVGLNGRYTHDSYGAALGVQQGHSWSLNLDAAYRYAENASLGAYLSLQQRQRDLLSSADKSPLAPSTNLWSNTLADDNTTVGLNAKHQGLMHGLLDVAGDLSYSFGRTTYATDARNCTDVTLCDTAAVNAGTLPDIRNEMIRLRLSGSYQLSKSGKVGLTYLFQRLSSDDYYYSAYRTGYTDPAVLPTDQQAPNYSVSLIMASYIYTFR